jgi:Spy/CpxP family protein refolding chaperone
MRKLLLALLVAAAACSEATGPLGDLVAFDESAILGFAGSSSREPGSRWLGNLHRLPSSLALTDTQKSKIDALVAQFETSTKTIRDQLAAIGKEAHAAAEAGKTREEVQAILAKGNALREQLHAAETALHTAIEAVLTAEQKAWLAANEPGPRDGARCEATLTDAQKTQIAALVTAFQTANKTDLDAIRAAHEAALAAIKAGKSREEVRAILEGSRAAMERVRTAERALNTAVQALLTDEQRAAGCFRIFDAPDGGRGRGPGGRGPGGGPGQG